MNQCNGCKKELNELDDIYQLPDFVCEGLCRKYNFCKECYEKTLSEIYEYIEKLLERIRN